MIPGERLRLRGSSSFKYSLYQTKNNHDWLKFLPKNRCSHWNQYKTFILLTTLHQCTIGVHLLRDLKVLSKPYFKTIIYW